MCGHLSYLPRGAGTDGSRQKGPRPLTDSHLGETHLGTGQVGTGTWEGHQHIAVLRGHSLHPRLVGHQVSTCLQEPLPKKLIWGQAGQAGVRPLQDREPGFQPLTPAHTLARAPGHSAWLSRPLELWPWLISLPSSPCTSAPSSRNAIPPDPALQILLILEAQLRLQNHNR